MGRIKIEFEDDGQPATLSSILKVLDDSIGWLQQSDDIEKLTLSNFLDREISRLQELKSWQPNE